MLQPAPSPPQPSPVPDLADHFLQCNKLGRHLTVFDDSRFVITDDFSEGRVKDPIATAFAAIYSKDVLVARAALLPLGRRAMGRRSHARFEELFDIIERRALSDEVRGNARDLHEAGFVEARVRALEAALGGTIGSARQRYRQFLGVVRQLGERKISAAAFRDEFLDFTYAVAGKLDFGIYSFCLDRIFTNPVIPVLVKGFLVEEILKYPPLIRRELLTNILIAPSQDPELIRFVRQMIAKQLGPQVATEIHLLERFKQAALSLDQMETLLAQAPA